VEKELLELVRELKFLVHPKKRNPVADSVQKTPQKMAPVAINSSSPQPIVLPKLRSEEKKIEKKIELPPAKVPNLPLHDLTDWYQKRFKTQAITPLSDKRAFDAKTRYLDGTKEASIVVVIPKKLKEGKELYKAIQTAIHQYLVPCMVLAKEQLSKELVGQSRLLILDLEWIKPLEKEIEFDPETKTPTLWKIPILPLEPYEILQTPLGKKRLWQALLSLPHS
jgi:hypothetical protein